MAYLIITVVIYLLYLFFRLKKALHMLQQNRYDKDYYYTRWLVKNAKYIFISLDILSLLPVVLIMIKNNIYVMILNILVYIFLFIRILRLQKKEQNKKPLVYTSRVKRLMFTFLVALGLILFFIFNKYDASNLKFYYLALGLYSYLSYLVIFLINYISTPVEKLVYLYYFNKAKRKIDSFSNLQVVGIAGSYGKTTTKNIVNTILSEKYQVLASPKSYNTPYGLMRTINENLDKFDQVFVAEMGAVKKGDLKPLCNLISPKYGILTKLGLAHLETFKTVENITKGKFELIERLPKDGIGILNGDDDRQVEYYKEKKDTVKWYGIKNKDVDTRGENIKCTYQGMSFDVIFKGDKNKYSFQTKLLGEANIYNILAGITLAKEMGVSISQIQTGVKKLKPVEHRLELKQLGDITIIDDAYNSNPEGSKMALDVLSMMPGKRIIVTPGMVELGVKEKELNEEFGKYIASHADVAILIGEKQTKPIYDGLIKGKFDKKNIYVLNDVKKAFGLLQKLKEGKTYTLLENDLPDLFSEGEK